MRFAALWGLALGLIQTGYAVADGPQAVDATRELPAIVERHGHRALFVDGAPFVILGAQVNNSSNWPAMLPKVWPAIEQLHANTVEVPVSWEQIEVQEGQFDFSFVDTLLGEARTHGVRLVLLWFGTWKNNSPNYALVWVKLDNKRFPRVQSVKNETLNSRGVRPLYRKRVQNKRKGLSCHLSSG
jgi:beta-galactosidase GanA